MPALRQAHHVDDVQRQATMVPRSTSPCAVCRHRSEASWRSAAAGMALRAMRLMGATPREQRLPRRRRRKEPCLETVGTNTAEQWAGEGFEATSRELDSHLNICAFVTLHCRAKDLNVDRRDLARALLAANQEIARLAQLHSTIANNLVRDVNYAAERAEIAMRERDSLMRETEHLRTELRELGKRLAEARSPVSRGKEW